MPVWGSNVAWVTGSGTHALAREGDAIRLLLTRKACISNGGLA